MNIWIFERNMHFYFTTFLLAILRKEHLEPNYQLSTGSPKTSSFKKRLKPPKPQSWYSVTFWPKTKGFGFHARLQYFGFLVLPSALFIMTRPKYEFKTKEGLIFENARQMLRKNIGLINFPFTIQSSKFSSFVTWYVPLLFTLGSLWIVLSSAYNSNSGFS